MRSILRPRVLIYGAILSVVIIGFISALALRANFQIDIIRDRNALFRYVSDDEIENTYHVKVMNKSQRGQRYTVAIEGLDEATIHWFNDYQAGVSKIVAPGEIGDFTLHARLPINATYEQSQTISLRFTETNGIARETVVEESRFWAPKR